jgi:BirA family biotin operon repressor/biotin-[acetyl-CoA-carboxylase] ligase
MMMGTSIIGIGLNVNQTSFDENLPNPISMKMITGEDFDLAELLTDISYQLSAVSQQPTAHSYIKHLYRYQQWALYEHEGSVKEMMIIGYDQFGRLILKEKNDHEVVCDLKEISFV